MITFYGARGTYGAFSNFSRHVVTARGARWPTSEHFFQAMKFEGTALALKIRKLKTPKEAAAMGRDRKSPLRTDWESVKDDIMREIILAKFSQHPELRALLLSTGDEEIVEHTERDRYWGDGGDGSGMNMLGEILMETREKLR